MTHCFSNRGKKGGKNPKTWEYRKPQTILQAKFAHTYGVFLYDIKNFNIINILDAPILLVTNTDKCITVNIRLHYIALDPVSGIIPEKPSPETVFVQSYLMIINLKHTVHTSAFFPIQYLPYCLSLIQQQCFTLYFCKSS